MRQHRGTFIACVLVCALSGSASAAATSASDVPGREQTTTLVSTHAVRGLVKSVTTTALVLSRSSKKASDLVFALSASTVRAGTIEVGSTVSVRYRKEGKALVAMAVTVTPHKEN
jgi:hypothetical protein